MLEACFGIVAFLRGDVDAARSQLEAGTAGLAAADDREIDAVWFVPSDPTVAARLQLALTHLMRGDLTSAEAELAHTALRADQLGFPHGPYGHAYVRFVESWLLIEAGQLDRAAVLAADLTDQAERHGFDQWRLWGTAQQASVSALTVLRAGGLDPTELSGQIATLTTFVDILRTVELNLYVTFFDSVLGRLLTAAGHPEQARARLDTALALGRDTGMCFYDAELLRLRAHTHTDPDARQADLSAALDLAGRQGATLFELRAALDDVELRGEPARDALIDVASRFPTESAFPELARAQAALR